MPNATGTIIIGHRGAGGHAPENTEAAIIAGLHLGADALEVDVQFTSDGVPVLYHDRTLERMAGVRGKVRDQTARELAGYDVGFKYADEYRGERILTLDEAARLIPRDTFLHVEIKDYDAVTPGNLKEVLSSLKRRGILDRCLIASFNEKILSSVRGLDSKLRLGLLVSGKPQGAAERAVALGCFSLNPEAAHADRALVEECHAKGLKVFAYTPNEPAEMRELIEAGVDGVYTDFPDRMSEVMDGRPRAGKVPPARGATRAATARSSGASSRRDSRPSAAKAQPVAPEIEIPPEDDEEAEPIEAAGAADADTEAAKAGAAAPRKRRRGRRGGRRHRRKGDAAPSAGDAPTVSAAPGVEEADPIEIPDSAEEVVDVLEIAPDDAADPDAAGEGGASDQPKKRRRRGRRGGRRHRRGGAGGSAPGGAPAAGRGGE